MFNNFKYLVTFEDSNVKVRFVGSAVSLDDFLAQLWRVLLCVCTLRP